MPISRSKQRELDAIYTRNADTVYRVCMLFLRGRTADAEDAMQTTFLRLANSGKRFRDREHERAFLIVSAGNVCRDMLKSAWNRRVALAAEPPEPACAPFEEDETLRAVMELPDRCKVAIYLYYYEGYACKEIARHMGKTEGSVWGYLHTGRELLRNALKEEVAK
ncbi:MAG: RNA polymerase sigma factor [Clostridia bacterium]|nr:RNA polymerase sigma factor [Clostridia bacterium]